MFRCRRSCLAVDVGQRSLKVVLVSSFRQEVRIDFCHQLATENKADLSHSLLALVKQAIKAKNYGRSIIACSVSSEHFQQRQVELPIDMDSKDIETHFRHSAGDYFAMNSEQWICDFQLQESSSVDKQAVRLCVITKEIINYYLDLVQPLPWRFSILEPDVVSLWRGFYMLSKQQDITALLFLNSARWYLLIGKAQQLLFSQVKKILVSKQSSDEQQVLIELLMLIPMELLSAISMIYITETMDHQEIIASYFPNKSYQPLQYRMKGLTDDFLLAFGLGLRGIC